MKQRKAADLKELTPEELLMLLDESRETLSKQTFQHALKQLHDTSYLKVLRRDVARINTILNERNRANQNG
ncbi:MAG: 50S ribosomal protein L29 [Desulfobulbaceae bacterium]|jgi:large subunit ribosomal protein L29|nr:50S ribosomal protein L29 [Candidatus Kapabacteria bacterium]MBS4000449.1 50S ribosomal protein L29 [Desulfobulbaceae bacterium]PKL86445.1 MAG: 50S ribosomal protein L29 [Ignavibacteriae bacterium HGW-Ignavibacteriae-1]